jgi:putative spermidine/putrescine transport system ATP-binding protein
MRAVVREEALGGELAQTRASPDVESSNAVPAIGAPLAPLSISARQISKSYGRLMAVRDVSIDVGAGEFLTLLGPSGSGKTTLLNIIAGFLRLDSGSLYFGDEDMTVRPVSERGLGMVFQNYALFPHMTVGGNVAFPLRVRRRPQSEIAKRVRSVLRLVRLEDLIDRDVSALSGGQRQRVALARAIVFNPRIVLMDEPLSALDKGLREQMQIEIRHLHEKIGATTIYVTHDQREALTMSDRVAVMDRGTIVQCDQPETIYHRPRTAFVAEFIGETTLLPVTFARDGITLVDGSFLRSPVPPASATQWFLAVRSEGVLMPEECGPEASRFPIVVRDVLFQGDSQLLVAEAPGGKRLTIRRPSRGGFMRSLPEAGQKLDVGLGPDSIILVPER